MLCFRCGSHLSEEADNCWNCGSDLGQRKAGYGDPLRGPQAPVAGTPPAAAASDVRPRPRTGSRVFGIVYKAGDLIAQRYRVKDIVGSGGAGVVYRAHDREIDVDVAVKVINGKLVQAPEERRLLSRQTKTAKKLSHQNCVRIYDDGIEGERPFFTMQFLEGLSLRRIIDLRREKGQVFTAAEVEPIFNQLCQALEYAHRTTFHGNLKPDNVLVLPDLLKVTDFALLRGLPRKPFLALQKSRGNNFRYLAPEVRLEVTEIDKAVDIYSLGVILAEMLTGHVYDDAEPDELDKALASVSDDLRPVIRKCLVRGPGDRFRSAADMHRGLKAVIKVTPVSGLPVAVEAKNEAPAGLPEGISLVRPTVIPVQPVERAASVPEAVVAAVEPTRVQEEPTQRLDIEEHGERPLPEDDILREPSISFAIDDDMIEAESTARSQETHTASPHEDLEELIDNPDSMSAGVGEEEATVALEEPNEDIRQVRARVDSMERGRSGLEEISNSAIELIGDPKATNLIQVGASPPSVSTEKMNRAR